MGRVEVTWDNVSEDIWKIIYGFDPTLCYFNKLTMNVVMPDMRYKFIQDEFDKLVDRSYTDRIYVRVTHINSQEPHWGRFKMGLCLYCLWHFLDNYGFLLSKSDRTRRICAVAVISWTLHRLYPDLMPKYCRTTIQICYYDSITSECMSYETPWSPQETIYFKSYYKSGFLDWLVHLTEED